MAENSTLADSDALVDMSYYAIGCVVLGMIGLAGNGLIIFTIIKHSEMREKSHYLVLSLSLADFFTSLGILVAAFATFVGYDKNIPQRNCLLIQAVAVYWSSVDNMLILLIGIDRVIILRHTLRYASWSTKKYVACIITIALCFGFLIILLAAANATSSNVALCILPNAINGFAKQAWISLNGIVCLGVLLSYVIAGTLVRRKKIEQSAATTTVSEEYQRLLTSLTIVAAVYVFSALFPVLYSAVFKLIIHLDPLTFQQYAIYAAWTILIQTSCAPFIYYMRSREYRTAFRRILCRTHDRVETVLTGANHVAISPRANTQQLQPTNTTAMTAFEKRLSIFSERRRKLTTGDIEVLPSVQS